MARKLKTMSSKLQRPWVQAELNIGLNPTEGVTTQTAQGRTPTTMRASGMHIINPPFTLAAQLRDALPWVTKALRQATGSGWTVEHGGH